METFLKYFNATMGFVAAVAACFGVYLAWLQLHPSGTAPLTGVAVSGGWIIALFALCIAMLATSWVGSIAVWRKTRRKRLTIAEQKFNLEMRAFVLSKLQSVVTGYFDVFYEIINRYEGARGPEKMTPNQWSAIRTLAERAASDGIRANFDNLKRLFSIPEHEIDWAKGQRAIAEFLVVYVHAKEYLTWIPRATGLSPHPDNANMWHEAERRGLETLRDLKVSPAARELLTVEDGFLISPK